MFGLANEKEVEDLIKSIDQKINQLSTKQEQDMSQMGKAIISLTNKPKDNSYELIEERMDELEASVEEERKAVMRLLDIVMVIAREQPAEEVRPKTVAEKVSEIKTQLKSQPETETYSHYCLVCRKDCQILNPVYAPLPSGKPAIEGACSGCGNVLIKPGVKIK